LRDSQGRPTVSEFAAEQERDGVSDLGEQRR
jgi:hypothetical protein